MGWQCGPSVTGRAKPGPLKDVVLKGLSLALLAVVGRALYAAPWLGEWDAVDFALAIHWYSLAEFQPHFPGYPVFVWIVRGAWRIFEDDLRALTLTSACFGGLTLVPLYALASRMLGSREALLTVLLLGVHPFHWLVSTKPLSDATGTFFVTLFLALAWMAYERDDRHGWALFSLASVALGMALGVRLSYFPFALTWLFLLWRLKRSWSWPATIRPVVAFTAAVALWLHWQVAREGWSPFARESLRFIRGHFTDWGGALFTDPDPVSRPLRLLHSLFAYGLGGYAMRELAMALLLSLLLALTLLSQFRPALRGAASGGPTWGKFLLAAGAPYLIWVLLGQNVDKGRHLLPLIPLLLLPVSRGVIRAGERLGRGWGPLLVSALLVMPLAVGGWRSVEAERSHMPAPLQLVEFVRTHYPPGETLLLGGEEKRLFDYYLPALTVQRVRSGDEIVPTLDSLAVIPQTVLVTSAVLQGAAPAGVGLRAVREFSGVSALTPAMGAMTLYELDVSALSP
ncbi:MAG: ArnT family glycosyltransferase [Candidatus Methylomirabilales bacterium]